MKENKDLEVALVAYISLIESTEYFDAHEVLEEAWHPLRKRGDSLHKLLKGLINGAVAFEHLKRGHREAPKRARKVMASYERYKDLCIEGIKYYELFVQASEEVEKLKIKHKEVFHILI